MAKNRKIPDKPKKPDPPPKNSDWDVLQRSAEAEGEDIDSDAGNFLDDDTEDFLPGNWTGIAVKNAKAKDLQKKSKPSPPIQAKKITCKAVKRTASQPNVNETTPKLYQPTNQAKSATIEDQLVIETSRLTLESAITQETTGSEDTLLSEPSELTAKSNDDHHAATGPESSLEAPLTETQTTTVTVSRLQVPASLIRQPPTEVERLQEENKSLKHDLTKQERDLKSAKTQAASAHAKAELATKKQEDHVQRLNEQYKSRYERLEEEVEGLKVERKTAQDELKAVQGERQKATSDLRKERALSEKLRREKKDLDQKLATECSKSGDLQGVIDTLRDEAKKQAEEVNIWRTRAH